MLHEVGSDIHIFDLTLRGIAPALMNSPDSVDSRLVSAILAERYLIEGRMQRLFSDDTGIHPPGHTHSYVLSASHVVSNSYAEYRRTLRIAFETCRGARAGYLFLDSVLASFEPLDALVIDYVVDVDADVLCLPEFSGWNGSGVCIRQKILRRVKDCEEFTEGYPVASDELYGLRFQL